MFKLDHIGESVGKFLANIGIEFSNSQGQVDNEVPVKKIYDIKSPSKGGDKNESKDK